MEQLRFWLQSPPSFYRELFTLFRIKIFLFSRSWTVISAGCVVPFFVAFLGCNPSQTGGVQPEKGTVDVSGDTVEIQLVPWTTITRCQGSLIADETTTVSAKVAGRIDKIFVDIGDEVSLDAILVQLDQDDYQLLANQADAQLSQARAAVGLKAGDPVENLNPENAPPVLEAKAILDEATKAMARLTTLAVGDTVSKSDLEVAESAERVAKARYQSSLNGVREKIALISVQSALRDLAHQRLRETKVLAPFDGRVQNRMVSPGTYVQAGQALMSIVSTKSLRFRSSVPERYAHLLKLGQKVSIRFDLSEQVREGQISRINPNLEPTSRSLAFEVSLDNSDGMLRSGLFGEGTIELNPDASSIVIPVQSVLRFAGVDKVWKIKDGQVKEQIVLLGPKRDDMIEIRTGLAPGDVILRDGAQGKTGRWVPPKNSAP